MKQLLSVIGSSFSQTLTSLSLELEYGKMDEVTIYLVCIVDARSKIMTSNQIAYASVQIDKQKADELERHDKMEEGLKQIALDLEKQRNEIQDWYNRETTRLTEREQDINKALQENYQANELWAKQEQLEIERARQEADAKYKEDMTWLEQQRVGNELAITEENKRHNQRTESIQFWDTEIKSKVLENQKYQFDVEMNWKAREFGLDEQRLRNSLMQVQNQWTLGLMDIGIQQRRNNINAETLEWNKTSWERQFTNEQGRKWTQTILPFVLPSADAVFSGGVKAFSSFVN